jgi:hypothetical protein
MWSLPDDKEAALLGSTRQAVIGFGASMPFRWWFSGQGFSPVPVASCMMGILAGVEVQPGRFLERKAQRPRIGGNFISVENSLHPPLGERREG